MKEDHIKYALKNRELKLERRHLFSHYSIVGFLLITPSIFIFMFIKDYDKNMLKPTPSGFLWFFFVFLFLSFLSYYIQKKRLKYKVVDTKLNKATLRKIIGEVATKLEWQIIKSNTKVIIAKTHPSFFSGSRGEHITILFDTDAVLVNSICDPDEKSSLVSMGRNTKNENTLIEAIKMANKL